MNTSAVSFTVDIQSKLEPEDIQKNFTATPPSLSDYKNLIASVTQQLDALFFQRCDIVSLINYRASFFDALLQALWQQQSFDDTQNLSLIAVGGYGRGELHPFSDIDILILANTVITKKNEDAIGKFITDLWDIGLTIGQSVRSLAQCIAIAKEDITVVTNLIESRLLHGEKSLYQQLHAAINADNFWPSSAFFIAKQQEQKERHQQFNNTEYNLEPNIKECPGGLRDIQMVSWIINRHAHTNKIEQLINPEFLTRDEFNTLIAGRNYLWKVRYALHMYYHRAEDRLLFDAQIALASIFKFVDNENKLAVEQFMQEYYRWALSLGEINDVLMQLFDENIVNVNVQENFTDIDENFHLRNHLIDIKDPLLFEKNPTAMLEVFVVCAEQSAANGLCAKTIRAISQNITKIDENFRANPRNHQLFLRLLQASSRVGIMLRYMKRFGVLGSYIPAFGSITGQTQHDLFHIYTVDAHTILLTLNIDAFSHADAKQEWPLIHEIINSIERKELLYLAAIFHDIAKGRGGDHSMLGATDAFDFCRLHGLGHRDSNLVSWLVENHLLMSSIAQRKDIDDPKVIREFALKVGDQIHLNYLFVLTVVDINATNKKLWNAWRASLMHKLYKNTQRALRSGLEHYLDREVWVAEKQQQALVILQQYGFNPEQTRKIWDEPNNDYFLLETADNIIRHTLEIDAHKKSIHKDKPLIEIHHPEQGNIDASEIFICMPTHNNLFAVITAVLEQLDLSVHDVRMHTTRNKYTMDSYYVLNADNSPLSTSFERQQSIVEALHKELANPEEFASIIKRRTPRQLKYFSLPTQTNMSIDHIRECNVLEVNSPDRPGLLARIARIFVDYNINLLNAKIATLGAYVEDIFFITDQNKNIILDDALCAQIQQVICDTLDQQNATQISSIKI